MGNVLENVTIDDYETIENRARDLCGFDSVEINVNIYGLLLKIDAQNYKCLSKFQMPVELEIIDSLTSTSTESDDEPSQAKDFEKTVNALDLSSLQNTTLAGSRWSEEEKAILKNFHKYILFKDINKPEVDHLNKWIVKRKSTKNHLFGTRSSSAIIAQYKKLEKLGEFTNVAKPKPKRN